MLSEHGPELKPRKMPAIMMATLIVETAANDPHSREAGIRSTKLVQLVNYLWNRGAIVEGCDPATLHGQVVHEYVMRPWWFLPPSCSTESNVIALQEMEFEPDGNLIKLKKKPKGRRGTR